MWIISVILILLLLAGYLFCLKKPVDWINNINKKEHKLYLLYPLSDWILNKTGLLKIVSNKNNISESLKALCITSKPELLYQSFWCKRIAQTLAVLGLFSLLSLLGFAMDISSSNVIDGKYIVRPDYGEGSSKVELEVTLNELNSDDVNDSTLPKSQNLAIDVKERIYTEEEVSQLFIKAYEYLKTKVLGENKSSEAIYENLFFCEAVPGTSISVKWYPVDHSLIKSDGTVCNEGISETGVTASVKAVLTYYEFKKEETLSFHLMPKQDSDLEIFTKELEEALQTNAKETANDAWLELPKALEKYNLSWLGKKSNTGISLFFFGVILTSLLWFYQEKELENQMKKRKQQMLLDYPEIINKFTLLINAGMTIRQAFGKIAEDYADKALQKGFQKRYAYEEILTTLRELKLGLPENTVYEQYGRRTGLISYIKFCSLISQNLKKGTKGFCELLMQEAIEAFEERKEIAKRLGEEAGTKLLIPMVIMLIIIFLIIMIPAFFAFSI